MEESKSETITSIDVASLPPIKKAKKVLSDKQKETLAKGREKRWQKEEIKPSERKEETENLTPSSTNEEKKDGVNVDVRKKEYDKEPLRWTERLIVAEQSVSKKDGEEEPQEQSEDEEPIQTSPVRNELSEEEPHYESNATEEEESEPMSDSDEEGPYEHTQFLPRYPQKPPTHEEKSQPLKKSKIEIKKKVKKYVDHYMKKSMQKKVNSPIPKSKNKSYVDMVFY